VLGVKLHTACKRIWYYVGLTTEYLCYGPPCLLQTPSPFTTSTQLVG
jgi:hypothetical protein